MYLTAYSQNALESLRNIGPKTPLVKSGIGLDVNMPSREDRSLSWVAKHKSDPNLCEICSVSNYRSDLLAAELHTKLTQDLTVQLSPVHCANKPAVLSGCSFLPEQDRKYIVKLKPAKSPTS